jgi:hypothetical protein|tara:strand:+ start:555 stop:821 length:267 start_codon:yes stop_codon:yes gene_type:complete
MDRLERLEKLRRRLDFNWIEIENELDIEISDNVIKLIENQLGLFHIYIREAEQQNIELLDSAFTPRLKKMLQTQLDKEQDEPKELLKR